MGKIYLQEKINPIPGKYVVADKNGYLTAGDLVTEVHPKLIIKGLNINFSNISQENIKFYCNKNIKQIDITKVDDHTLVVYPDEFGSWQVLVTLPKETLNDSINITEITTYTISLSSTPSGGLENRTWAEIKELVQDGIASSYFSIGDSKNITLESGYFGKILIPEGFTVPVFIIGFDHNASLEGSGITFQFGYAFKGSNDTIAFVDSDYDSIEGSSEYNFSINNTSNINSSWASSTIRTQLLSDTGIKSLYNLLPNDLKQQLSYKYLYTDNHLFDTDSNQYQSHPEWVSKTDDHLFLLSEYEIFGFRSHANPFEQQVQQQYDYYKNNSKKKYKYNSENILDLEGCNYWTRSRSYDSNISSFCYINNINQSSEVLECSYSEGIAPAFFIGTDSSSTNYHNIRIVSAGGTDTTRSVYSSYITVNDTAYYRQGKILVSASDVVKIWAKAGGEYVSYTKYNTYGYVGLKVNGIIQGNAVEVINKYTELYTLPTGYTGLLDIKLVRGDAPTSKSTAQTYYIEVTMEENN